MNTSTPRRLILYLKLTLLALYVSVSAACSPVTEAVAVDAQNTTVYLPLVDRVAQNDWLQFNGDPSHTGNNTLESSISPASVGNLKPLFKITLPGIADGAPVYLSAVSTAGGTRDLIFVTTRNGYIAAMDARTGGLVWSHQYGPGSCLVNNNPSRNESCYTTSSPAIDPDRQYIYSYGLDEYVHKYEVGSGAEIKIGGWPELTSLKGYDEKGSSALSIATASNGTSYLYVAHAGYPGDRGDYQGHITAINLTDGTQKVFNALCSNQAVHFVDSRTTNGPDCFPTTTAAIWARPGVVYDPYHDRILMSTGNGSFQPASFMWGDTVFSLNPDGSSAAGVPLDSYTPTNYQELQDTDLDLGSTAPAILPPAGGKYPHLAVQGGKDGILRLINLDQLSGQNGAGHVGGEVFTMQLPMGGMLLTQPAVWINPADNSTWIFISNSGGMAALQLNLSAAGDPSLVHKWTSPGGTSPLVANGVVFVARSGLISAFNATDGALLWSDSQVGSIHWESPVVINGTVYISDQGGRLSAYSLP